MLKNYLKIAYRVFLRRKFFTFISLFAISFTLIVLTVVTAFLDHALGPLAPETKLDRTIGIFGANLHGPQYIQGGAAGYKLLDRYARNLPNVERMSVLTYPAEVNAFRDGERLKLYLRQTDGQFWQILDFDFLEGGPFTDEDEKNGNRVAVINEATRQQYFGGSPAVGRTIDVDGQNFSVVGVVANVPILRIMSFSDVWVPMSTAKTDSYKSELVGNCMGMLLAKSADDIPAIEEEYKSRMASVEVPDPKRFTEISSSAGTFFEFVAGQMFGSRDGSGGRTQLIALIAVCMLLFMLLPTVNLVNINVSRILERSSEIGVRKAFGASSWTLVGQFLVENLAITLAGGLIGFVASFFILRAITASGYIQYAEFHLNYRVFLYGLGIALVFGVLSGVYPAWKMSRLDPVSALNGGIR